MKRMCRERIAAPPAQSTLRALLPHLRIITDPATLARLNAEAGKLKNGKTPSLKAVSQADLDYR